MPSYLAGRNTESIPGMKSCKNVHVEIPLPVDQHFTTLICSDVLKVEFLYGVDFISNEARGAGDDAAGGGAVAVGPEGSVDFHGDAEFTDNKALSGASGGALANFGSVSFLDFVDFFDNNAQGGGNGGAVTTFGSLFFGRRSSFNMNVCAGTSFKR